MEIALTSTTQNITQHVARLAEIQIRDLLAAAVAGAAGVQLDACCTAKIEFAFNRSEPDGEITIASALVTVTDDHEARTQAAATPAPPAKAAP